MEDYGAWWTVHHLTVNQRVVGSSPTAAAIFLYFLIFFTAR
jgi:hypothetical protein